MLVLVVGDAAASKEPGAGDQGGEGAACKPEQGPAAEEQGAEQGAGGNQPAIHQQEGAEHQHPRIPLPRPQGLGGQGPAASAGEAPCGGGLRQNARQDRKEHGHRLQGLQRPKEQRQEQIQRSVPSLPPSPISPLRFKPYRMGFYLIWHSSTPALDTTKVIVVFGVTVKFARTLVVPLFFVFMSLLYN